MAYGIDIAGLTVRHRGGTAAAIDDVTFSVAPGRICGLFGRDGAGKSTLLAVLAAYRRPSGGTVRVDGEDPYENARLMSGTCLVDEGGGIGIEASTKVREVLEIAEMLRPNWDPAYAEALLERFEVPREQKVDALARGRRARLAVTIALASRAPLTLFDEPHLALDPPSRQIFYDELRADLDRWPRTVVLAGAAADEADETASLVDDVLVLRRGRLLAAAPAARLRSLGSEITGPADAVAAFVAETFGARVLDAEGGGGIGSGDTGGGGTGGGAGTAVLADRRVGRLRSVVLAEPVPEDRLAEADRAGLDVGPVPLRDFVAHLSSDDQREAAP
ncbi:ATP-binding cassette domain-containing protein [Frankia sp. CNm7]|uniref:ATP-binding cassette domain-containing protein n=1 Tax=Frankia nepalensis TaxID=1836974 RepID=A0A937RG42_9ACTN|nr:ATP-binding cassette domain-containing protein [Frankia nepalensis]MBL7497343.1 ATP-binding cassette domain-containing protein [Frankia nepalensis]MBL7509700.1 ATP-binding cassette domain-containing protein [Frankia nepalensis]MBL7516952.1 ATP-binding cassette domain-containing protein [Frankia nepalensis]MBL7629427.1 ATP-binding cassette domain-containing protein [Frankia nepalensis]